MPTKTSPRSVLEQWISILGDRIELDAGAAWRDLWPVIAEDGARYMLKRLGPWRNLPVADEARIVAHLARQGIRVPEFIPTDRATLFAGPVEDSFILTPALANDSFTAAELVSLEETIGNAVARLHLALASYPWPANSYTEQLDESLAREQTLPAGLAEAFVGQRDKMIDSLANLPMQLVHGDMTPENVLLQRPGAVSGFIDFDHLPHAPRIWDIAKYLSRRMRLRWRHEPREARSGRLDHIAGFVAGYHETAPLEAAEIEALPAAIAAGNVLEASYHQEILAGTLARRRLPDHKEVLADTIEAATWHLANHEAVAAAVRAGLV